MIRREENRETRVTEGKGEKGGTGKQRSVLAFRPSHRQLRVMPSTNSGCGLRQHNFTLLLCLRSHTLILCLYRIVEPAMFMSDGIVVVVIALVVVISRHFPTNVSIPAREALSFHRAILAAGIPFPFSFSSLSKRGSNSRERGRRKRIPLVVRRVPV